MQQKAQEAALLKVAQTIERAVDDELNRIDDLEEDDITDLRKKRKEQVMAMQQRKQAWLARGHGTYTEISGPQEFFECAKGSERVVCHFKRRQTSRCAIVDRHLEPLARKHFETRFISVDCEKYPMLPQRFNVVMLPTIMLIEGGNTFNSIIGFDEFGGSDDFPVEVMEKVLAAQGVINERDMFANDQEPSDGDE